MFSKKMDSHRDRVSVEYNFPAWVLREEPRERTWRPVTSSRMEVGKYLGESGKAASTPFL
jgi:hypothetical protein